MSADNSGQSSQSLSPRCLVNGQNSNVISVFDRSLQYGDGCFETMRIYNAQPVLAERHYQRLTDSCTFLRIPLDIVLLKLEVGKLLESNQAEGVLKIIVSRGSGGRGYTPSADSGHTRILQFHDMPASEQDAEQGVELMVCQHRLSMSSSLAGHKHLNRLDQVLASSELVKPYAEGLCLDQMGVVIEACRSNVLMAKEGKLYCPSMETAGVHGVMQQYLEHKFHQGGIEISKVSWTLSDLSQCDEIFLCNSVIGVWPVIKLVENARVYPFLLGSFTQQAIQYSHELLAASDKPFL